MKTRRGSSYWTSELSRMIEQFGKGDIVTPVITGNDMGFVGVVRDVDHKCNKVIVGWGSGPSVQHDPDEIMLIPWSGPELRKRMSREDVPPVIRREIMGRLESDDCGCGLPQHRQVRSMVAVDDEDPQFVGEPETHGMDKPRGGGFSIMQDLADDLREESFEESGETKMASRRGMIAASPIADEILSADAKPRSRRAMYWNAPGRKYRLTTPEQESGVATCPKCKGEMARVPYTRQEQMYTCQGCGFMVPSGNVGTSRVEVEIEPDGGVEIEVASMNSRRGIR